MTTVYHSLTALDVRQGGYQSWIGCNRSDATKTRSDCDTDSGRAYEVPVDVQFVPSLALAALLDVRGEGKRPALARLDMVRANAASGGRFRTNNIPLENVSVGLWRPSSGWKYRTAAGFAERVLNQTGDWQVFDSATDG